MLASTGRPDAIFVTADRGPGQPELALMLASGRPAELVVHEAKVRKRRSLMTGLIGTASLVAAYDFYLLVLR